MTIAAHGGLSYQDAVQQSVRAQNLEFRLALLPRGGWVDEKKVALESLDVLVVSGLLCLLVNLLGSRRSASDAAKRRQTQKDRSGVKDGAAAAQDEFKLAELQTRLEGAVRRTSETNEIAQAKIQQAELTAREMQTRLDANANQNPACCHHTTRDTGCHENAQNGHASFVQKLMIMKNRIYNPHNFVPDSFNPRKIAIIGGKGSMGRRLAVEFFKDGYEVHLTGEEPIAEIWPTLPKDWKRAVRKWNTNICNGADVVVFAVPIPVISGSNGLARVFGHTPPRGWRDKLVMDICSIKAGPTQALAELKGATVIGTHPMFGPKLKSLAGQTVFICPVAPPSGNQVLQARLELRLKWLKEFWNRRGVEVVEISPGEHDSFMPSVQFGVLLSILLYGEGLRQTEALLNHVEHRGTPNSRILCTRLARMISPAMLSTYVNLAFDNPHNRKWLEVAMTALMRLQSWMAVGNREAMRAWLQELADFQPPSFRAHFGDLSVFFDECLANREFLSACLAQEQSIQALLDDSSRNSTFSQIRAV